MARVGRAEGGRWNTVVRDGVPFYATLPNDLEVCCDCALTHRIKYNVEDEYGDEIKGAQLKVTVWRDNKETNVRRGLPAGTKPRSGFMAYIADSIRKRRK